MREGNPNYTSSEINAIRGLQASEIKKKLGNVRPKEVIGRKKIHLLRKQLQNEGRRECITLIDICRKAKVASSELAKLSREDKNRALQKMADALEANIKKNSSGKSRRTPKPRKQED